MFLRLLRHSLFFGHVYRIADVTARFDVPEVMYQVMLWGDRGQNGKGIRRKPPARASEYNHYLQLTTVRKALLQHCDAVIQPFDRPCSS